ncbi:MAG: phosphotransferase [Pseudomonadota bacterium]
MSVHIPADDEGGEPDAADAAHDPRPTAGTDPPSARETAPQDAGEALNPRAELRREFLLRAGYRGAEVAPLAGDASARRYFRVTGAVGGSVILMDAPPAEGEAVAPFAALTGLLRARGLSAPEILDADFTNGLLLLEDLGDALFARTLATAPEQEAQLYQYAVDLLVKLHADEAPETARGFGAEHRIAPYDWTTLRDEAMLFADWYMPGVSGALCPVETSAALEGALRAVCEETGADRFRDGDARLTLRDYHAENLIWLPDRRGLARVGLLDYQDALAGNAAYDLVSLLEDARRDTPPSLARAIRRRYAVAMGLAGDALARFEARYAALGAQRNLKILGIFSRLWMRDGKPNYLRLLPRVWLLLQQDVAHPAMEPLRHWVERHAPSPDPDALAALRSRPPATHRPDPRRKLAAGADAAETTPVALAPALDTAMVLAAGFGTRLRPLTDKTPKPLIKVGDTALLERALARVGEVGVARAVVNAHHLPDQLHAFAAAWNYHHRTPSLEISDESRRLLETGGGVAKALPQLDRPAFLTLNSDNIWTGRAPLKALVDAWDPERMDALLLLAPLSAARGYSRNGDFSLDPPGRLVRRGARPEAPLVYTGAQILAARAFEDAPSGPFSLNVIWDQLIATGRAYGVLHVGLWADVGAPAGLKAAEALLNSAPSASKDAQGSEQ